MTATAAKSVHSIISFTADPKALTAVLRAVREFASEDPTRRTLNNVLAEPVREGMRFTATDGHTLCTVLVKAEVLSFGSPAQLDPLQIDTLLLTAKAAGTLSREFVLVDASASIDAFPLWERVLTSKVEDTAEGALVHAFNGRYLARIGSVQKHLKAASARIQMGATCLDPLRADLEGTYGSAALIIMPCRM